MIIVESEIAQLLVCAGGNEEVIEGGIRSHARVLFGRGPLKEDHGTAELVIYKRTDQRMPPRKKFRTDRYTEFYKEGNT